MHDFGRDGWWWWCRPSFIGAVVCGWQGTPHHSLRKGEYTVSRFVFGASSSSSFFSPSWGMLLFCEVP